MARSKRIAYKAHVALSFNCNGSVFNIDPNKIVYILIDSDYENNVLPIIYVTLAVNEDLYKMINANRDSGTFTLVVQKFSINGNNGLDKTVINDVFNYVPSTQSANYMEDLNVGLDENNYRRITVGLVSATLVNTLRKSFNGVFNEIDQFTLVSMCMEDTNFVVEEFRDNAEYEQIIIPPLSTRYQFIKFLFEKNAFYWTKFIFFMDFERCYLVSKEGNPVDAGDGRPSNIIVDIKNITEPSAFYEGVELLDGAYYVYVNPSDAHLVSDEAREQMINNVITVDEDLGNTSLDIDYSGSSSKSVTQKQIFVRNENAALIKNELEFGSSAIQLSKAHMDGSVFTPNKQITVVNYGDNASYNGRYAIAYKKEFFKNAASEFVIGTTVGLKKIGQLHEPTIKKGGKMAYTREANLAVSKTAKKTSTGTQILKSPIGKSTSALSKILNSKDTK